MQPVSLHRWLAPLRRTRAFTLLELLVVMALAAALVGIALGAGQRALEFGRQSRARAEIVALTAALDRYRLVTRDYPRTTSPSELLQSLIGQRDPLGNQVTLPSFLDLSRFQASADPHVDVAASLLDPWGNAYRYAYRSTTPWSNPRFVLYSAGPDGAASEFIVAGGYVPTAGTGDLDNVTAEP